MAAVRNRTPARRPAAVVQPSPHRAVSRSGVPPRRSPRADRPGGGRSGHRGAPAAARRLSARQPFARASSRRESDLAVERTEHRLKVGHDRFDLDDEQRPVGAWNARMSIVPRSPRMLNDSSVATSQPQSRSSRRTRIRQVGVRGVEQAVEAFAVPQDAHIDSRAEGSRDADERSDSRPIARPRSMRPIVDRETPTIAQAAVGSSAVVAEERGSTARTGPDPSGRVWPDVRLSA